VQATEYPPETPTLLQVSTTKVVMIVDTVSPTPFALLRRAKNFEYRDSDAHLQEFASYEDPVKALTDECLRVLKAISSTNQSAVSSSKTSTSLRDASWSRFEDMGFGASVDESDPDDELEGSKTNGVTELRPTPLSHGPDLGRPTTPSWADFLSTGFHDEKGMRSATPLLLPPDKVLPPITTARGQSSQSHKRTLDAESTLGPGELASITTLDLDDSFWWVWISSLSGEEPAIRKAVFGRCTLLETVINGAKWLVLEEQVKGAAPEPEPGAYIAEKKRFFGFSRRTKVTRRKSSGKKTLSLEPYNSKDKTAPTSKTSIGPDQHARIQAAAAALQRRQRELEERQTETVSERRARNDDTYSTKTNSVMTMHTTIFNEASQAMKWAHNYDKDTVRAAYLRNSRAGTGENLHLPTNGHPRSMTPVSEVPSTPKMGSTTGPSTPAPPLPVPPKDPPKTANDVAADAATVPLPVASPEPAAPQAPPESVALEPMKSVESAEERHGAKKLKKKPGNTAFKGIFSSTKKKSDIPMKPTGADPSAIAAARAALENKAKAQDPTAPPKSPASHRLSGVRKKPTPETPAPVESAPVAPPQEVAEPLVAEPEPQVHEAPDSPPYSGPPKTRRDAEYDALSRIDTNERAMADREFSSFDQGPLLDQPAFVPVSPVLPEQTARDIVTPVKAPGKTEEPTSISPQDRWAQIRKNAAERAGAGLDEAPSRTSQAEKTDDGDTSGEESKS
jgi:hypothetical protein